MLKPSSGSPYFQTVPPWVSKNDFSSSFSSSLHAMTENEIIAIKAKALILNICAFIVLNLIYFGLHITEIKKKLFSIFALKNNYSLIKTIEIVKLNKHSNHFKKKRTFRFFLNMVNIFY